jgi:hypothetical protein
MVRLLGDNRAEKRLRELEVFASQKIYQGSDVRAWEHVEREIALSLSELSG